MDESLETTAFLANSGNRVRVLRALAEGPHTRATLAAETSVTRATDPRFRSVGAIQAIYGALSGEKAFVSRR